MERIIFKLEAATYIYPEGITGISGCDFEVKESETVVILGPNGCGKSTLLKVLDALYFPQKGKFYAFGEEITEKKLQDRKFNNFFRRNVGLLFQDVEAQLFSPTVREEISFSPRQMGMEEDEVERRVTEVVSMFGLESILDRYPYSLSGGEKRKVALASIFSLRPEVYLLDEPTANLDPGTESKLIDLILSLKEDGKIIVLATQDLILADHLADRVVLMDGNRRIVAAGTKKEVFSDTLLLGKVGLLHSHRKIHHFVDTYIHSHLHLDEA